MEKQHSKCFKFDEIKSLLGLPEFTGIKIHQFSSTENMMDAANSKPSVQADFSHIPEEIKSTRTNVYRTNKVFGWGDQHSDWEEQQQLAEHPKHNLESTSRLPPRVRTFFPMPVKFSDSPPQDDLQANNYTRKLDPAILSGYDEYLRTCPTSSQMHSGLCGPSMRGQLRLTPQATLSLSLSDSLQVDMTIDGAIRVINPKAYVAMAVNGLGTHAAVMHPMGRVLQEASTTNLLAYDMAGGCHKFAKLWPKKATFTSTDMNFAYTMDQAGTRSTMTAFPRMPSNDITLPVFYATSRHGALYKEDAAHVLKLATHGIDSEGATVWTINKTIIKYNNGDLRIMAPPSVFLRTSPFSGHLGLSTDAIHCTASNGEESHLFVRFGANKMHYNGHEFKLRTLSQAAGFDENNRITIF